MQRILICFVCMLCCIHPYSLRANCESDSSEEQEGCIRLLARVHLLARVRLLTRLYGSAAGFVYYCLVPIMITALYTLTGLWGTPSLNTARAAAAITRVCKNTVANRTAKKLLRSLVAISQLTMMSQLIYRSYC